ncbi:MAG: LysR family transcriptional regulator [Acetobacteraceae bacterium]
MRQSTISQHIKRLEGTLQRPFAGRADTHSVALTPDGDAMVDFAHAILDGNERMGTLLFAAPSCAPHPPGASRRISVLSGLPDVLAALRSRHSSVDLELVVGLSGITLRAVRRRELDVGLRQAPAGDARGRVAWRRQLVWVGPTGHPAGTRSGPLPLFCSCFSRSPSVTRALALDAVERGKRSLAHRLHQRSLSGIHGRHHRRAGRRGALGAAHPGRSDSVARLSVPAGAGPGGIRGYRPGRP